MNQPNDDVRQSTQMRFDLGRLVRNSKKDHRLDIRGKHVEVLISNRGSTETVFTRSNQSSLRVFSKVFGSDVTSVKMIRAPNFFVFDFLSD